MIQSITNHSFKELLAEIQSSLRSVIRMVKGKEKEHPVVERVELALSLVKPDPNILKMVHVSTVHTDVF